jgi:hypothetical protein
MNNMSKSKAYWYYNYESTRDAAFAPFRLQTYFQAILSMQSEELSIIMHIKTIQFFNFREHKVDNLVITQFIFL